MENIKTDEAGALASLQKKDTAIAALSAQAAAVPGRIKALEAALMSRKAALLAGREALATLQLRKKDAELKIAEADEAVRKHQRELNMVKDNDAFKALLSEIEGDKAAKDELETEVLGLLDEMDKAAAREKELAAEFAAEEAKEKAEAAAVAEEGRALAAKLDEARAAREKAAAAISPALMETYEALRASRAGVAVAAVSEAGGRMSCGGCHMALTPQKALDVTKPGTLVVCPDCRRLMYHEKTLFGK